MTRIFPARRVETSERRFDPQTRQMTGWTTADGHFHIEQEAEDFIDETLGRRFGLSPFFLMNLTRDPAAWAAVFFSEIIMDSDLLLSARAELREDIRFAAYGDAQIGMKNPPLGAMVVRSAEVLSLASTRHEVFRKAWDALRSCEPDRKWVAVVDL
jgi:hypothetical protein